MTRGRSAWATPAAVAVAVVVACAALVALESRSEPRPPLPRAQAVAAARSDERVADFLQAHDPSSVEVIALDRTHWRVTWMDGPRLLMEAAVGPGGAVDALSAYPDGIHPPGARTLWRPAFLALLVLLFVLACGTLPLLSWRNLDALVIAGGFSVAAVLHDARLLSAQVYVGAGTLAYVFARCARVGFGGAGPARPPRWSWARRDDRLLGPVALALLAGALTLTITSTGVSDVAFANLAGATELLDGRLPYGHLGVDVVHGDTYPLLSYVLFVPAAAVAPVHDSFDSLDGALWTNAVALLALATCAYRLGGRGRPGTGLCLAAVAFPPALLAASAGGNDVPAAALAMGALLAVSSRPPAAVALLTLAGWVKLAPVLAAPFAARPGERTAARGIALGTGICIAGVLAIVAIDGTGALDTAWDALRFQFERGAQQSFWQRSGLTSVQPVLQAATVGFAAFALMRLHGRWSPQRMAALAAAALALLQLAASYWTYLYSAWLMPFLLVGLLPPGAGAAPPAPRRSPPPVPRAP